LELIGHEEFCRKYLGLGFYESRALHWKILKSRILFPRQEDFAVEKSGNWS
jgi:hypothetical protein